MQRMSSLRGFFDHARTRCASSVIEIEGRRESKPLPYAVEYIEGIAQRLHNVLTELQEVNRANESAKL